MWEVFSEVWLFGMGLAGCCECEEILALMYIYSFDFTLCSILFSSSFAHSLTIFFLILPLINRGISFTQTTPP